MEDKKKTTKPSSGAKKRSPRTAKRTTGKAGSKRPPDSPTSSPLSPSGGGAADLHPAVALVVSLLAPGLGLLLLDRGDRVKDAFLIFGLWFAYVAMSFFLTFFAIGVCCWLPLPLLNVAAGIHSFDEMALQQGGSPVLFQSSFRIFKD